VAAAVSTVCARSRLLFARSHDLHTWFMLTSMCMRLSKRVSRVNLAEHLNSIYRNSKGKNMYIGVHELCQLTSKPPCAANEHINCDAAQLVHW